GARNLSGASLTGFHEHGVAWGIVESLELLAKVENRRLLRERATRLFGAAEALRHGISFRRPPTEHADYDESVSAACSVLGEPAFETAWAEGQAMTLEQAVAYALEEATA